jgi:hypothetical protein
MANPQLELEINSASQAVQRLQNELAVAQARESAIYREQRQVNSELRAIKAKIQDPAVPEAEKDRLTELGQELESRYNQLEREGQQQAQKVQALQGEVSAAQSELRGLQQRAAAAPPVSTGTTTNEAAVAKDDAANSQSPSGEPEVLAPDGRIETAPPATVPSNAAKIETPPTTGTNDPPKPAEETQTVPSPRAQEPIKPGSPSNPTTVPVAPQTPAARAPGDDNTNGVVSRVNDIFGGPNARVVPQANVLDRFANYTYNISIYITNSDEYRNIGTGQRPNLTGANLLIQSGGAAVGQRNQSFPLDFYIDDLNIRSVISGKGTGGAHNAVDLTFKIYEPYGVTFLERLAEATRQYVRNPNQQAQKNNYAAQAYLMVIRFYGYDENGELVRVANALQTPGASQEPGLIVEKYIPFRFTEIKFRLAGKIAEYDCAAVALRDYAPPSQTRGIIPYNIELTSVSLQELLGVNLSFSTANRSRDTQGREPVATGTTSATRQNVQGSASAVNGVTFENQVGSEFGNYFDDGSGEIQTLPGSASSPTAPSQSSAPPKATAAPRPNLVTGLTAALNEFQAELVKNGTYTYPDVYEIIINESILREAKLQPPEAAAGLRSVPMTAAQNAGAQKLGIKQSVNRDSKNVAAAAGMSIVQFLDQVVRNSSYIIDQQTKIWRKDSAGKYIVEPRATGGQVFAWYRIGMDAVPIRSRGIDPKRGDYSYRITYTITPYLVNDSKSAWFPQSRYQGTHKKYEYWFTGLNTSIINYEQTYNYLYYITINGGQGVPTVTSDYREYEQYAFQARAPEASQGAAGPVFDPAAQAASVLYSPGDTAQINLQIMGDPAWIQQGEIVSGVPELGQTNYGPFLPNGTINYDSREVLFEVTFNTAGDYNLETGLMDVQRRAI